MCRRVGGGLARGVAQQEHRSEGGFEITRFQRECVAILGDVVEERAGEAVGLLFQVHGLLLVIARSVLDRVAPLVCEHERHRERPERLGEMWHQRDVVVGDEVALQAIERVAFDIGEDRPVTLARRHLDAGSRGDDARTGDRLVALAVEGGEFVRPVALELGDRGSDHLLVRSACRGGGGSRGGSRDDEAGRAHHDGEHTRPEPHCSDSKRPFPWSRPLRSRRAHRRTRGTARRSCRRLRRRRPRRRRACRTRRHSPQPRTSARPRFG